MIDMNLVTQPEAGSILIASQLAMETQTSDTYDVTLLKASWFFLL